MRDRPQLRSKMKSLLGASAGSAILVVGGLQACETSTTSGNLLAPDTEEIDSSTSGNLMAPDSISVQDAVDGSGASTETTDAGGSDQ